jgi:hypothetical protein
MDIHNSCKASGSSSSSLPQGFSVYQPSLGATLQWFPAMGTQELDDMLHTYLPGTAPIADKRAAVSVDFLEHLHLTGQTFKFYQVEALVAAPVPSASSSPVSLSGASSLSGYPATPTWDFNNVAYTPSSTSSQTSASALKARKSSKTASRQPTTDFSHLPGMKIMTRDGLDVTNAASRGSKTKEQRDHAHLMRIIKACDSCRAKKIRCDPSHKRRAASTVSSSAITSPPPSSSKQKKRASSKRSQPVSVQPQVQPVTSVAPVQDFSWEEFDATMALAGMDNFDDLNTLHDPWTDFIHFPEEIPPIEDAIIAPFLDSEGSLSPSSSFATTTTSSGSLTMPHSPSAVFTHGDLAASSYAVTNRTGPDDDSYDMWARELAFTTNAEAGLQTQSSVRSSSSDSQALHVATGDGSGVPGDYGLDATLLSSTGTGLPRHRLEDPGTVANSASSLELGDHATLAPASRTTSLLETSTTTASGEATSQQTLLSGESPTDVPAFHTNATVLDSARLRAASDSSVVETQATSIATQTESRTLVSTGGRVGILSLLPMSGPLVPGLAQLMLGGTSELIAASAPLSSKPLALAVTTMAVMATSFVACVSNMLAQARAHQLSHLRQRAQLKPAVAHCRSERCLPMANAMVGSVC